MSGESRKKKAEEFKNTQTRGRLTRFSFFSLHFLLLLLFWCLSSSLDELASTIERASSSRSFSFFSLSFFLSRSLSYFSFSLSLSLSVVFRLSFFDVFLHFTSSSPCREPLSSSAVCGFLFVSLSLFSLLFFQQRNKEELDALFEKRQNMVQTHKQGKKERKRKKKKEKW